MVTKHRKTFPLVALLLMGAVPLAAHASSHREAPAIANDPAADNTDVYAWVDTVTHDKLVVVFNYIPLEEPAGGPNFHKFSDDVLYELHIARGNASLAPVITYQFRFHTTPPPRFSPADPNGGLVTVNKVKIGGGKEFFSQISGAVQTYTVTRIEGDDYDGDGEVDTRKVHVIARDVPVAPINYGPRTQAVLNELGLASSATYDDAFASTFIHDMGGEGRVWAGPRDDGFYVDLGGIFDLANLRPAGQAQDGVSGFNTHSIALEIPISRLTSNGKVPTGPSDENTVGVWAAASRRKVTILEADGSAKHLGPWVQVSRLGLPLINEAVIGIQDKDKYNRTSPETDVENFAAYFLNPVIVKDAQAVGIYDALHADYTLFASNRIDIIDTINLKDFPTPGAHNIPLSATGDVLRVDLGIPSAFPNGRPIPNDRGPSHQNEEQADVTDVLLSVLLTKGMLPVSDGVNHNDKAFLSSLPYLALPWEGFSQGHGKPAP
jgi:Domain of unknown function (DUF4331)